jgi:hypothetical protein
MENRCLVGGVRIWKSDIGKTNLMSSWQMLSWIPDTTINDKVVHGYFGGGNKLTLTEAESTANLRVE